jgi:heterodisulfide reductase subunit A
MMGKLNSTEQFRMSTDKEDTRVENKITQNDPTDDLRIGVFVCDCGSNIAGVIDVSALVKFSSGLKDVVFAEEGKWICAVDYLTKLKESIIEHDLNRVVVACCTPRTHEPTFKATLKEAGLNPYLLEFVSIREQSSWVHKDEPEMATETAKDLIRMGVSKARYLEPGTEIRLPVGKECLVIGGGIAGITAALVLGDLGFQVLLVERCPELGGILNKLHRLSPEDVVSKDFIQNRIARVLGHERIKVMTSTEVAAITGYVGNFEVTLSEVNEKQTNQGALSKNTESRNKKVSTIIVATGMEEIEPTGLFGFGNHPNVITHLQLEQLLKTNDNKIKELENIAFISCVSSRNDERGCCNVGCLSTIKNIKTLKEMNPRINSYLFFRDFNITGQDVQYHYNSMDKYSASFRYPDNDPPRVSLREDDQETGKTKLEVQSFDILTGEQIRLEVDLLVLTSGYRGDRSSQTLKGLLKVSTNPDGFFTEAHVKLRPLDFANEGIYVCGCARWPKNVKETMEEAMGAAMRAAIPMEREYVETEGIVADVDPEACVSCGICTEACAFGAPGLVENNIEIIKAICKGCGTCAASCPTEAIDIIHFSDEQLLAQVDAALEERPENKIVVFACHWCALGAVDNAGVSRFEYPANLRIIRVMCSGRVDPKFILHAFERGALGVLVAGCEIPTCHYISGNFYASKKVLLTKKLLELAGIKPKRVRLEWLSAAQGARFAEVAKEFSSELDDLGAIQNDGFTDVDLQTAVECTKSLRLRTIASKLKNFVESGNVYGEIFSDYEINRLLNEVAFDEFIRIKIEHILSGSQRSVEQLSSELRLPAERIFRSILDLSANNKIAIDRIENNSPMLRLVKPEEQFKREHSINLAKPEENAVEFENNSYDYVIVGTSMSALQNALRAVDEGNSICLLMPGTGPEPWPWILSKHYQDYQGYLKEYNGLLDRLYNEPLINILRNTKIQQQKEDQGKISLVLKRDPTFVDEGKCNNCGKCLDVCPVNLINLQNHGLSTKHAIYDPWPRGSNDTANTSRMKFAISKCVPYCQASCAISMDVRGYIGKIADGLLADAMEIIQSTNPLPDVCGKVCDHECESTCARGFKDEPMEIRKLKRYATENEYDTYKKQKRPIISRQQSVVNTDPTNKVAIIGSGPAGLAAAHELVVNGYPVTIFESGSQPGGMLKLGIPDYRLPNGALQFELDAVLNLGIDLKLNTQVGKGITIFDLKAQGYKAIFVAVGAQKGLALGLDGEDAANILNGLEFLKEINSLLPERLNEGYKLGKNVAVIGGGNVAVDCARTARRLGAENVTVYYRRTRSEMPAAEEELIECENEGIRIEYLVSPKRLIIEGEGPEKRMNAMEFIKNELGTPDKSGRRRPIVISGSEFTVNIDILLIAIGQTPDLDYLSGLEDLELTTRSTIIINNQTGSTNIPGIFAGGDVVTGPKNVVGAIKSGKIAANGISKYLSGAKLTNSMKNYQPVGERRTEEMELLRLRKNQLIPSSFIDPERTRGKQDLLPLNDRLTGFSEVEPILTVEEAENEAHRCLGCRMCIGCGLCSSVCPESAIDYTQTNEYFIINTNEIQHYPQIIEGRFDDRYDIRSFYRDNLNIITPFELSFMLEPTGYFNGRILRPLDGKIPNSIAFLFLPEREFVNNENLEMDAVEFELLLRSIQRIQHELPDTKITIFSKEFNKKNIPEQYRDLIGDPIEVNVFEKYFEMVDDDTFNVNIENSKRPGCIEIQNAGKKTVFELCVVNTGLYFKKEN